MKLLADETLLLKESADVIFDYVSNMENFGKWFTGVISVESVDDSPHSVTGKTYLETVRIPMAGSRKIKIEVFSSQRPLLFITEGSLPFVFPRMEIGISECDNGCEVNWKMYSRNRGLISRLLFLPVVKQIMTRRAGISLQNLKNILEK